MTLPAAAPPLATSLPPGVVDVTPEVIPGPATSQPNCYFLPSNDCPAPFVIWGEYLLLRPYRRDLDFAIVDPNNNLAPEGRIASLDWETRNGVRAGFTWRPRDAATDLAFTYLYAYSQ